MGRCVPYSSGVGTGKMKKPCHQGPVVQSIISLTSSLRGQLVKCFTTLKPKTLMFLLKNESFSLFLTKILAYLRY